MAVRSEALECSAFARMKKIYDDRRSVLEGWKAEGRKVVCVLGYDVPDEIIIASGMTPFRVTGYYGGERVCAEKYLEYSFGAIWKGLFESVMSDYSGLMDYCVLCSSSDMFLKLFYYLRTLKGLEPERPLPELKYLDYELVEKRFKTQQRNERELRDLIETVEGWSGNRVTNDSLREAVRLCNEYRRALRELCALRAKDNCRLTGSEALVIIGASMFMDKRDAINALHEVTRCAASWSDVLGRPTYYVGSPQEITEVYEICEECGLNIIGEDHDMGERMFDTDVREDLEPVSALAERLLERMPSSEKGSIKCRVARIGQRLEENGAEAVLTFMNVNDEAYVWDQPSLTAQVLDPRGIAHTVVQKQTWPLSNVSELKAQLAALAGEVKDNG